MKKALIFPGQGSQYPGMGKELADNFAVVRQCYEEANDSLGFSISRICFEGPENELQLTENTQPALLATSIAFHRLLAQETGLVFNYVAGHSLGEYSALVAADALDFGDALRIVRSRGRFMQEAVPVGTGAMAAVLGADTGLVEEICAEAAQGETVVPANYNCPGQIVISGSREGVNRAIEVAKARGIRKALLLPVSVPSHCALMAGAGERLAAELDKVAVRIPAIPLVSNVEASPCTEAERIRGLLVAQISSPVLWEKSVREMVELGVSMFVETGPGKVLSGLVKKIDKGVATRNFDDLAGFKAIAEECA